jgi:hypothetical protein
MCRAAMIAGDWTDPVSGANLSWAWHSVVFDFVLKWPEGISWFSDLDWMIASPCHAR